MPKFARPNAYNGKQSNQNWTGQTRAATATEAAAGDSETLYISPATLDSALDTLLPIVTSTTLAGATNTNIPSTLAAKTYIDNIAIAGSPAATETTPGIAELATQAETIAYTDDERIVTPLKLGQAFAAPADIGTGTPGAATFDDLTTDGNGTVTLVANAASLFDVTGAGNDLTLSSDAGRVIVNGEEAAANAITLVSAAGGLDVDVALQMNLASSQNAADAIRINASAGGIDIDAAGAAGEDINIANAAGSIVLSAGESANDALVLTATAGGIDILASGAAAGEDIDIVATGSSVNISSTENVSDSIVISSTNGGIDITANGAVAGEDIDIQASSSINLVSTEDAANAIYLRANGGTSETVKIHSDQGTGVASVEVTSDVGGVTVSSGLASADAINLTASNAAGGIDVDAGTAGVIVDTTGGISLDAAAASNFTATGAFDITLNSTAGSMILTGGEAATDAIDINASDAAGGIDIDAGTGGIAIDSTGAISIDGAAASNMSVSGAGIDLTLASSGGRVVMDGAEAAADAVRIVASDAAGGVDIDAGTNGVSMDATGDIVLTSTEDASDSIYLHANGGTSETIRIHSDQGTGVASVHLESDVGGVTLTSGLASADAINLSATAGGVDIDGALQVNIASSQASTGAVTLAASNASGSITHTGRCVFTPDSITSDNAGVAASVSTLLTLITTDGDSNLDNVTLADGQAGQVKMFAVVAAGNAADSVKITPANMAGGTQITFAADPTGLGCTMCFDGTNWTVVANNGGTIA